MIKVGNASFNPELVVIHTVNPDYVTTDDNLFVITDDDKFVTTDPAQEILKWQIQLHLQSLDLSGLVYH